jgi:hypothetical protein
VKRYLVRVSHDAAMTFHRRQPRWRRLRRQQQLPIEAEVLLVLEGPGTVTAWTKPTAQVRAIPAGKLTGPAVKVHETVLAALYPDQTAIAWLTANEVMPGQHQASV